MEEIGDAPVDDDRKNYRDYQINKHRPTDLRELKSDSLLLKAILPVIPSHAKVFPHSLVHVVEAAENGLAHSFKKWSFTVRIEVKFKRIPPPLEFGDEESEWVNKYPQYDHGLCMHLLCARRQSYARRSRMGL